MAAWRNFFCFHFPCRHLFWISFASTRSKETAQYITHISTSHILAFNTGYITSRCILWYIFRSVGKCPISRLSISECSNIHLLSHSCIMFQYVGIANIHIQTPFSSPCSPSPFFTSFLTHSTILRISTSKLHHCNIHQLHTPNNILIISARAEITSLLIRHIHHIWNCNHHHNFSRHRCFWVWREHPYEAFEIQNRWPPHC